jgi:hypothetical protein
MVVAKIGGSIRPCTKRQKIISSTLADSAIISVGTLTTAIAVTITRLRPSTSATAPVNGAARATAKAVAVMVMLMAVAVTPNSCASEGSRACTE